MEVILQEWENFARDVWPSDSPCIKELRDHAQEMLLALVSDMQTRQSEYERREKSVGNARPSTTSDSVDLSSARHAVSRWESGFDLRTLVAEYRSLRASVLYLWNKAAQNMTGTQIDDMTRFNECVDQLLAESVMSYATSMEQSRELFLGILGHDLRTPLCAMTTAAGLLEEDMELKPPARRLASLIVISAREMGQLVLDMLDFAGTRLGTKMNINRQAMNLEQLCREVIDEVGAEYPSRGIELEADGDGDGEWDRQRLRQLMSNLLVNAVKHGSTKTSVRLFIRADDDKVVMGVRNQGPPISPAMQAVIFDPLRHGSVAGMPRHRGSLGLGLYIARQVASAHGGTLEVRSDERETVFTVELPRTHGEDSDTD